MSYAAGFGSATMFIWWIPRAMTTAPGSAQWWTTYLARNGSSTFACPAPLPEGCGYIAPRRCNACESSYRTTIRSRWTNRTHSGRNFGLPATISTYSYTGFLRWIRTQITYIDSYTLKDYVVWVSTVFYFFCFDYELFCTLIFLKFATRDVDSI